MKQRLQRILSVLCILTLIAGCLTLAAGAEEEKVSRIITVEWSDEDNYEGLRPASVTMSIGDAAVTLNEENGWTGEAAASADAEWTVAQVAGYTASVRGKDVTVVSYSHKPEKTFLKVSVSWADQENASGLRPESVRLNLLADGKPYRTATVNARNSWTVTWEDLPRNAKGGTTAIAYSVSQAETLDAYTTTVEGAAVTNTLKTGSLSLQASVSGVPEGADVSGLTLTVSGPDPKMPVVLTLADLAGGKADLGSVLPGAYLVQESNADSLVEGYVMDPAASKVGDAVYVKAGEAQTLSFAYAWKEPEEQEENTDPMAEVGALTFEIIGPDARLPMTVTYAQFTDGKYELDNLIPGEYAVVERNAEGLVRAYTLTSNSITGIALTVGKDGATASLINRYVPAPTPAPDAEVIDIPVVKIWNDDNNKDGNRPESITVKLFANGIQNETVVLTAADGWEYTFTDKPRYDENGEEIVYTLGEEPVEWYTSSVNGSFITNDYTPEVTSASVAKIWDDEDNKQNIRPTSIAVTLLPVGEVYVLNAENGWSFTRNGLPTKINGEPVTYSWREQETVGYVLADTKTEGSAMVFTNRVAKVPEIPKDKPQAKKPGDTWYIFEDYDTALGIPILINHVGDCFD